VGNSGNSTEPHVHVHLQTTAGPFGEGIPLFFHDYRQGTEVVARGMPPGGPARTRIEHAGRVLADDPHGEPPGG
jgi:hypothetical protein